MRRAMFHAVLILCVLCHAVSSATTMAKEKERTAETESTSSTPTSAPSAEILKSDAVLLDNSHNITSSTNNTTSGATTNNINTTSANMTTRVTRSTTPTQAPGTVPMMLPPEISKPYIDRVIVPEDSNVYSIHCQASGNPKPYFEWYKNDVKIKNSAYIEYSDNGTLTFYKYSSRENGYYQCRARNDLGTAVSVKVNVLATVPPKWPQPTRQLFQINQGRPFNLKCSNVPKMVPKLMFRWYFSKDSNQVPLNSRVGVDSEGTLHFSYVKKSDSNGYLCGLAPDNAVASSTIYMSSMGTLDVLDGEMTYFKPTVQYTSRKVKAILGKPALLECFFSGLPQVNIRWKDVLNKAILPADPHYSILSDGRKLQILSVTQSDAGSYTCTGLNDNGEAEGQVTVNVTSAPIPVSGGALNSQIKPVGSKAVLSCKTRAVGDQHVDTPVWSRDSGRITTENLPSPSRYHFNDEMTELSIDELKKDDSACFQCNVSNSEGYMYYSAFLKVLDAIDVTQKPVDVITVTNETFVDLTLMATGDVCCKLDKRLFFNGTERFLDLLKPPFRLDGERLYFNASTVPLSTLKNWMGVYNYTLSNPYDSVTVTFTLEYAGKSPGRIAAAEAGMSLWWIAIVCGALVIITIFIIIVIYKNKTPGDTYKLEVQELKHNLDPEADILNKSFQEF